MVEWRVLAEFPNYSVSDEGQIRNDERDKILSGYSLREGHPAVGLWRDNRQHQRSVAALVAKTFLQVPQDRFNAVIHLNSDLADCRASNLAWRPLWFAQKFTRQFNLDLGDAGPIKNINTGAVYDSVWDVVYEQGVLFNDVIRSIYHKTYVFPIMQCFEWT